jgi:ParB family chromosome partitioning protein
MAAEAGDDGAAAEDAGGGATIIVGGQPAEPTDEDDDVVKPLPDRLVSELTAHRTLALREALGGNPHVALTALLHKLVRDTFQRTGVAGAPLQVNVNQVYFREQGKDLAETPYAHSIEQRHEEWKADVPDDDDALWDWLVALDDASRLALLAHCASFGVNALYERPNPYSANGVSQHGLDRRMAEADRLARATDLNMVEAGFRPTVENYLGRVTKARILEAVREGAGDQAAQLIDHLKKGDMAKEAERLLAETGWLPEPLRLLDDEAQADADDETEALPAFLTDDDTGGTAEDPNASEPVDLVAAE